MILARPTHRLRARALFARFLPCFASSLLLLQLTVAIKQIRTQRRVALTGSPLQNNLIEYFTMVDFVRKGMLGTQERFKNYFEAPILNGMLRDSSKADVKVGGRGCDRAGSVAC